MITKLGKIRIELKKRKIDSFLFSNFYSIFYLTGFKGAVPEERESFLVFSKGKLTLLVPRLYQEEALKLKSNDLNIEVVFERDQLLNESIKLLSKFEGKIGFESEDLKFSEYEILSKASKNIFPIKDLVVNIRLIKTEEEVDLIRKAQDISYKAFKKIQPLIKPGVTEKFLDDKLKEAMLSLGADSVSFESIVAAGKNSAFPHYETSTNNLKKGDIVLFDFGAKYKGYCGDTTRVVFLGKPKPEALRIYNLVKRAQEEAIKNIKAGQTCKEAFEFSNNIFVKEKVDKFFTHGLGHGIGIAVHEDPKIRMSSEQILEEGMVFSIEPGLYFPEWGGVRIEDLVVVRKNGVEILSNYTTEVVIL